MAADTPLAGLSDSMVRLGVLLGLSGLFGCETIFPPLRGDVEIGREAYAVFVGGGDHRSDLYAYVPARDVVLPLTYTTVAELAPALAPDGTRVAFLRAGTLKDSLPGTAWVLDLRTGIEDELALPRDGGQPRRIGWTPDGAAVVVGALGGVYRFDLPFGGAKPRAIDGAARVAAESSFAVLLGEPVFARVVRCERGQSLCTAADTGAADLLARGARDPVRWGADSVAYFVGDALEVRPLGAGRVRRVRWSDPPRRPRAMTFFSGGASYRGR